MKVIAYSLLLLLAIGCSTAVETEEKPSKKVTAPADPDPLIKDLEGKWIDDQSDDSTVFHEHWQLLPDGSMDGLGFVMLGKDTVFIEHLGILHTDTGTYYSAQIPAQNEGRPVYFKLHPGGDSLSFVNPAHDFPQRIVYRKDGDAWHVDVSGRDDDGPRSMRFHLMPREEGTGGN
jgi:hypothetical protein